MAFKLVAVLANAKRMQRTDMNSQVTFWRQVVFIRLMLAMPVVISFFPPLFLIGLLFRKYPVIYSA